MMSPRIAGAIVVALLVTTASPARAQLSTTAAIIAGSVFGAVDVFFVAYDLTMSERDKPPSRGMVFTELPVMTLQIATGISMVAIALQPDQRLATIGVDRSLYLPLGAILATVAAPLFAHAVRHSTARTGSGMHALRLAPTQIGDARAGGPGLVLSGVF